MKTRQPYWMIAAAAMLLLPSCKKEWFSSSRFSGEHAALFTATTEGPETKTAYSGQTFGTSDKKERIDWVTGDWIRIYCEQTSRFTGVGGATSTNPDAAPMGDCQKYADYSITASGGDTDQRSKGTASPQTIIQGVNNNQPLGLHFSQSRFLPQGQNGHDFYALYPSPDSKMGNTPVFDATDKPSLGNGTFSAYIPASQKISVSGSSANVYYPEMKYAPLWAAAKGVNGDATNSVGLSFHPGYTAFEITLTALEHTTDITGISLTSSTGTKLSGGFTATISSGASNGISAVTPATSGVTNKVSADFSLISGSKISLSPASTVTITLLTIPGSIAELTLGLDITLNGSSQTRSLKLMKKDSGGQMQWLSFVPFVKHRIGTISAPVVVDAGGEDVIIWDYAPVTAHEFSVSDTKKVRFTTSDLTYLGESGASKPWRLADMPWSRMTNYTRSAASDFDFFGWATSGKNGVHPWKSGGEDMEYGPRTWDKGFWDNDRTSNSKWDWGRNNIIWSADGMTRLKNLHTLSQPEWEYLLTSRSDTYRYLMAEVNGVNGMLIFPDAFSLPAGISISGFNVYNTPYHENSINLAQFARMAANGAVFLRGDRGYWTSSAAHYDAFSAFAYAIQLTNNVFAGLNMTYTPFRRDPMCVRLVQGEVNLPRIYFTISSSASIAEVEFAQVNVRMPQPTDELGALPLIITESDDVYGKPWYYSKKEVDGTNSNDRSLIYPITHFAWATAGTHSTGDGHHRIWEPNNLYGANSSTSDYYGPGLATLPANTSWREAGYEDLATHCDWGWNFQISSYPPFGEEWFTPSKAHWEHLLGSRSHAAERYALGTVADVKGLILLPDEWNGPVLDYTHSDWDNNIIPEDMWGEMKLAGAVFLPAAGQRNTNTTLREIQNHSDDAAPLCMYWTSTSGEASASGGPAETSAYRLLVSPWLSGGYQLDFRDVDVSGQIVSNNRIRARGCAVRLVRRVKEEPLNSNMDLGGNWLGDEGDIQIKNGQ